MWIAEAIPPAGPLFVPALAALFAICACIVAIGMVKLVDAISRSFFGTLTGAVAWIPYAGKVAEHSLHKVEQKISHGLGSAEQKLDGYIALSWHHMAGLYRFLAHEVSGGAVTAWHLAQQARGFVMQRDVSHAVRTGVAPVRSQVANVGKAQADDHAQTRALHHSVAQGVYPRLKSAEWEIDHVLEPGLEAVRERTKALEHGAVRTFDWIRAHKFSVATSAFVGAVAFAMTRLGVGWIRCRNWKRLGRTVCGLPAPVIDALIAALLAEIALANFRALVEFAQASQEEVTHEVARMLGLDLPRGQFTIE